MKIRYACTICRKEHVKLWRPYMDMAPLICAECAEKRQTCRGYEEVVWKRDAKCYVGTPTGRTVTLPKWTVDEEGRVPSYEGPGPEGCNPIKTDQLIVDMSDISKAYSSGQTTIIPAIPSGEESFWGYTSVPKEKCDWWRSLPTR